MKLETEEVTIAAPGDIAHELFLDVDALGDRMAADAALEPVAGGPLRWTDANGDVVRLERIAPHDRAADAHARGWRRHPEPRHWRTFLEEALDVAAPPARERRRTRRTRTG